RTFARAIAIVRAAPCPRSKASSFGACPRAPAGGTATAASAAATRSLDDRADIIEELGGIALFRGTLVAFVFVELEVAEQVLPLDLTHLFAFEHVVFHVQQVEEAT